MLFCEVISIMKVLICVEIYTHDKSTLKCCHGPESNPSTDPGHGILTVDHGQLHFLNAITINC